MKGNKREIDAIFLSLHSFRIVCLSVIRHLALHLSFDAKKVSFPNHQFIETSSIETRYLNILHHLIEEVRNE